MAVYTFANLDKWALKTQERAIAITKQATNDMLNDIEIVPGINRGGSRVQGTIPRDTGALAASQQSTLNGQTLGEGQDSHVIVVASLEAGDVARFSWGGATAPYAVHVHYGANGVPGTFWVDVAAGKWISYAEAAVKRAKP